MHSTSFFYTPTESLENQFEHKEGHVKDDVDQYNNINYQPQTDQEDFVPSKSIFDENTLTSFDNFKTNLNQKEEITPLKPIETPYFMTSTRPYVDKSESKKDDRWITVFGFAPEQASYVLKKFSSYGEVLDHKMGDGNWMNILFKDKIQAQKAKSRNGQIFGKLMLGVVDCFDKNILEEKKKYEKIFQKIEKKPEDTGPSTKKRKREEEEEGPRKAGFVQSFFDYIFGF